MSADIILIGPMGAGKSTQGRLLSEKLNLPHCPMDDRRWDYYREIGYDEELANRITEKEGFLGKYRYWKPFEAHAVERLLSEHSGCVIDFGAGHSVYEDDALFMRVQRLLEPYRNVVLLLPSADLDESVRILTERSGPYESNGVNFHEHFVKHPSNHALAKTVVYTRDQTPEETRDEIIRRVHLEEGMRDAET